MFKVWQLVWISRVLIQFLRDYKFSATDFIQFYRTRSKHCFNLVIDYVVIVKYFYLKKKSTINIYWSTFSKNLYLQLLPSKFFYVYPALVVVLKSPNTMFNHKRTENILNIYTEKIGNFKKDNVLQGNMMCFAVLFLFFVFCFLSCLAV